MLVITYLGKTYVFTKTDDNNDVETDVMFRDRCWWIVKNIVRHSKDSKTSLIALSHIWASMKYYGSVYEPHVVELLKTYEDVYIKNNN
jgi:hypothetical protein